FRYYESSLEPWDD
nr:Chain B, MIMOTOPE OF THE NICOTINIC ACETYLCHOLINE RECEPTOR [synthetic construct]